MDISTNISGTNFNLRTRGIIIKNNKLLCINDKGTYFYLPGGRIHINENAKVALKREIKEESKRERMKKLWNKVLKVAKEMGCPKTHLKLNNKVNFEHE